MKPKPTPLDHPLACEILRYQIRHPNANDTLEGITLWWLLEQKIHHAVREVEAALNELVERHFIIARPARDGRLRYRLNRRKENEILGCVGLAKGK